MRTYQTHAHSADLAGVSASFLITSTEHAGGDLIVVVVGSITDSVTDDGDAHFLEDVC